MSGVNICLCFSLGFPLCVCFNIKSILVHSLKKKEKKMSVIFPEEGFAFVSMLYKGIT